MGNDIFSAVIELNKIRQQAYEIYLPIVEELCNREVSEEELSHCLDYLLDFADDASMLELYKKLCRRFVYTYPGCINFYVKELKDALMDNITKFLMELGKGFAFVGREYTIPIEGTEEKIDLLFYHLYLHCYVVVEVKIVAFTSRDIGQIGTYVNIVDDLVKTDFDAKTIGLIICKSKNNILAKYAVNSSKEPIGISEYKLSNLLPVEYRASMPTIEEIENELR